MLTSDDIWAELRRRRIQAKDIAAMLGVAPSTVTRYLHGETRNPDPRLPVCVASLIGAEPGDLAPGESTQDITHNLAQPQAMAQTA